ncbi:MAG: hypothetical protein A2901_08820 [Elusimicrobia bacterium RIFCSPLOWO2_01_FULL_54_10]|nr:MAG: hypothetical protein A2901_08820 [Elusimicrobia bacterium RIFCSPLOWO2_01_FULL_54_10]
MKKRTVLVADDEVNLLNLLKDNLEEEGYEVFTAADGEEALKVWVQKRPDAVVLDIEMPRMNGWKVLEEIRKVTLSNEVPVILILSAYAQHEDIQRGMALGANKYLTKPFKTRALVETIEEYLKGK